jgi:hypothetical protein
MKRRLRWIARPKVLVRAWFPFVIGWSLFTGDFGDAVLHGTVWWLLELSFKQIDIIVDLRRQLIEEEQRRRLAEFDAVFAREMPRFGAGGRA